MSAPSKLAGRVFFCAVKMVTFSPPQSGNILGKVVTFYGNNLFYVTSEREHSIFFQFENVPANVTKNVTRKNPKTLEKQGFLSEW